MIVSYGGLALDDAVTYYIYMADLEREGSLVYSGQRWALAGGALFPFQRYYQFGFYSTKNVSDKTPFQFQVVHLGNGKFSLRVVNASKSNNLLRNSYTKAIYINDPIFNTPKNSEYAGKALDSECIDDFDCEKTLRCRMTLSSIVSGGIATCQAQTDDIEKGYTFSPSLRYTDVANVFPTYTYTQGCKWTECLDNGSCNSDVLLLNPGNQFNGNGGWILNGQSVKTPEGSYTCAWAWQHHYACCPKDQVAIADAMFELTTNVPVAEFGALASGMVEGLPSAVLRVASADHQGFCGTTDYRSWSADMSMISFFPNLLPVKLPLPDVWDNKRNEMDNFTYDGSQKRTRATKFRVVFSTSLIV
jgi:hypothetical protein